MAKPVILSVKIVAAVSGLLATGAIVLLLIDPPDAQSEFKAAASATPAAAESAPPIAGTVANFSLIDPPRLAPVTVFADLEGRDVGLGDFAGKVVLLNIWATWCGPCVEEMPSLDRLQSQLAGDGLVVLALSQDRDPAAIPPFYEKLGLNRLGIYVDSANALARAIGAKGLPTTVIVDRAGLMVGQLVGAAQWDTPDAIALIRHYLGNDSDLPSGSEPTETGG